jgi:hypothetical protein
MKAPLPAKFSERVGNQRLRQPDAVRGFNRKWSASPEIAREEPWRRLRRLLAAGRQPHNSIMASNTGFVDRLRLL